MSYTSNSMVGILAVNDSVSVICMDEHAWKLFTMQGLATRSSKATYHLAGWLRRMIRSTLMW
jgi:hypothetical protein